MMRHILAVILVVGLSANPAWALFEIHVTPTAIPQTTFADASTDRLAVLICILRSASKDAMLSLEAAC